jgi:uncharacterized protein (TIGR01777 family)
VKVILAGGSGQLGQVLARSMHAAGHDLVVLSRSPSNVARAVAWDARSAGAWRQELDGADVVVNLAGRNVNCRYTAANRAAILQSRVESTRAIGEAIAAARRPPAVWLQMSTATIYAHRFDAANDERTGIIGGTEPDAPRSWRFSIEVARAWEEELARAATPRTRRVALRAAMVMSPDRGGIFDTLLGLVRRGLGGPVGGGRQYVSWIHEQDFVGAIEWLIARDAVEGPVNVSAPEPLPYRDFMTVLRRAAGVRVGVPAPGWALSLGAVLMRTEPELVLKSRRVVPGRLLDGGFAFAFPRWDGAAADLCRRWR